MATSEWQAPAPATLSRTSPGPGVGRSTSLSVGNVLKSSNTIAFIECSPFVLRRSCRSASCSQSSPRTQKLTRGSCEVGDNSHHLGRHSTALPGMASLHSGAPVRAEAPEHSFGVLDAEVELAVVLFGQAHDFDCACGDG